jgi:acetyl-CoA C-acetyltransferase
MNVARQAALGGGLPKEVPAFTVNRVCGSGAQAVVSAYAEIVSGISSVVVAGGTENMDRAPYLLPAMRFGSRMGDASAVDALLRAGLHDAFSGRHSGWHTEDLVERFDISRARQDAFAAESQRRFAAAQEAGWFDQEITPVTIKGRKGNTAFSKDESNRLETTVESLAKLRPAFRPVCQGLCGSQK